jgi:hypothetical protein
VSQDTTGELSLLSRAGLAVGAFICAVSFSLFIHTVSQLSSPIVAALFISGGIVGRRRGRAEGTQALSLGFLSGGVLAAVAAIALTAAGR